MIAFARAGPMPGSLSSSSALAELISTNSRLSSDLAAALPVTLGAVAAGELGDLDGKPVCATGGSARSMPNPIAAKQRFSLIAVPPLSALPVTVYPQTSSAEYQ